MLFSLACPHLRSSHCAHSAAPSSGVRNWRVTSTTRASSQLPRGSNSAALCTVLILVSVLRTLLILFTRADFLYNDLVFDPLAPVTSSKWNRGSNQNLVNAHSRTQDCKPGVICHFHCVRSRACRPSRNSWKHFCLTLHSRLTFDCRHFIRRFYLTTSFMLAMRRRPVSLY